jgi:ABC-type spermidine/putrescine transport system permease subunit II
MYQVFVSATLVFLIAPLVIVLIISVSESAWAQWPPTGFSLEWYANLPQVLSRFEVWEALRVSLGVAAVVSILATVVGGFAAFALVRYEFKYQASIEAFFLSPLIYPWIVVGIGLLLVFSAVGIEISFWTLVAGHTVAVLPYPIRMIASNLHNFNESLEEAASNLGANEFETYLRITIPLVKPGIFSGLVFAFILSFNQYIISLFLAPHGTETVPLKLFELFYQIPPAQLSALATVLMVTILGIVVTIEYAANISTYL